MNRAKEYVLRWGLAIAAALTAGPPILHFEDTQRAVGALFDEDVRCDVDVAPSDPAYPYDAIVVPGAGRWFSPEGTFEPTEFGKRRLQAAAIAYSVEELATTVVLLNGTSSPGEDTLTEVRFLQNEVKALSGGDVGIPDEAIITENRSTNTATNMAELARIAEEHGFQKIVIVTDDFHTQRATLFACTYGIAASSIPSERVIAEMYPDRAKELNALYDTEQMQAMQAKETAEIVLFMYDPRGYVPTLMRSFLDS